MVQRVPTGFVPTEDQGMFYVSVTSPPGATLERTKAVVDAVAEAGRDIEGIESIATLAGQGEAEYDFAIRGDYRNLAALKLPRRKSTGVPGAGLSFERS